MSLIVAIILLVLTIYLWPLWAVLAFFYIVYNIFKFLSGGFEREKEEDARRMKEYEDNLKYK